MSALGYVGLAYAIVWILIFAYVWRLTAVSRRLADKLEKLDKLEHQR